MATLFASILDVQLFSAIPLIVAISLVYGATRHEEMWPIMQHSFRAGVWIVTFMAIIFALLFVLGWNL